MTSGAGSGAAFRDDRAEWQAWVTRDLEAKASAPVRRDEAGDPRAEPDVRRPVANRAADISAVRALAQACVNVELFTIPLYMVALYSIQGFHQITAADNDFYAERVWPGSATTADPQSANDRAFNLVFSVFVEEMLHLQLAGNIASAIGVTPVFTGPALQDEQHGWTCYGANQTVIPHVIDLADTQHDGHLTVTLGALDSDRLALLMAIEEPAVRARTSIKDAARGKYFPGVPFEGWSEGDTEADLPMMGTIDHLYQCYYQYLALEYDDGTTLFEHLFVTGSQQNDMFNVEYSPGHPKREYPGFEATVTASDAAGAFRQVTDMINAITDQGEGSLLSMRYDNPGAVVEVKAAYEAATDALEVDYPYYTDQGELAPSADTVARTDSSSRLDHYARFSQLTELLDEVVTWPAWLAAHGPWTEADFVTGDGVDDPYGLPAPAEVADAYNRMGAPEALGAAFELVSRATVGILAAITTVLDQYWSAPDVVFPYPAMTASADRMSTCWALFGQAPDLSLGMADTSPDVLYHACQGLDLSKPGNQCAPIENFHGCKGSNLCMARGGCGFVHPAGESTPGAQCGFALVKAKRLPDSDGLFSAPSDNRCATMGGCAVPITDAQLFPEGGVMELVDFVGEHSVPEVFDRLPFDKGAKVHDVAWQAYLRVMEHRDFGASLPDQSPPPSDIRLVFPPST